MAAGTRTAPDVSVAAVATILSLSFIDSVGDIRTESVRLVGVPSGAAMEAYVAAVAAATTSSLYRVDISYTYEGARTVQNTTADGRFSADDKVRITMRDTTLGITKRHYVPAPVAELFEANSENIDTAAVTFTNLTTAIDAIEPASWNFSTVAFTEHSESNSPQSL